MKKLLLLLGLSISLFANAQMAVGTDNPQNMLHVEGDARVVIMPEANLPKDSLVVKEPGTGVLQKASIYALGDIVFSKGSIKNTASTTSTSLALEYTYTAATSPGPAGLSPAILVLDKSDRTAVGSAANITNTTTPTPITINISGNTGSYVAILQDASRLIDSVDVITP